MLVEVVDLVVLEVEVVVDVVLVVLEEVLLLEVVVVEVTVVVIHGRGPDECTFTTHSACVWSRLGPPADRAFGGGHHAPGSSALASTNGAAWSQGELVRPNSGEAP